MAADFGYAGEILKVDLSNQGISRLATAQYTDRFLGGRGIAAKIYSEEVPHDINALDPGNCLIMITGPIAGFTRFAGCRWQICGKSPGTDSECFSYANLGGSWGAWLKYAGYDGLIVTGKAENPVYLYIDSNGRVDVRDASRLWGKTTVETREILHQETGRDARILTVGPAGENLVSFATVLASENASGSAGFGSVMGSKKLKAIVVKVEERKPPVAADPEKLQSLAREVFELNARNWEDGHQKSLIGKKSACYGCISGCSRHTYRAENDQQFKSFCQSTLVYMDQVMKHSRDSEIQHLGNRLCDKYGLDTVVMRPLINWLALCHEEGILGDDETGLPLSKMGGAEFIETLTRKITYREGFGDILARGTIKAAEYVGKGSQKLFGRGGIITRASETNDYDPRLFLANALIYATEPRRAIQELHALSYPLRRWVNWHNGLEDAFLSTEVFQKIAEDCWGGKEAADFSSYEGKALAAKRIQDYQYAKECLILCDTLWPIHQVNTADPTIGLGTMESRIVSAITGRKIDEAGLLKIGERVFNLQRMILLGEGWGGRQGDTIMDYLFEDPIESVYWSAECIVPGKNGQIISRKGMVVDRADFEKMKSEYYALRGWDVDSGVPTRAKLAELGLD